MSLLSSLAPLEGSTHYCKRVGRGRGSGLGQTSGKGHKGQLARAGGKVRRGFEGGQTPLIRRLPKVGFSNVAFQRRFEIVNLDQLENLSGEVTLESLKSSGLIKGCRVKILAKGTLTKKLNLKVHKISDAAKAAVEKIGGTVELVK